MRLRHLDLLVCPRSGRPLELLPGHEETDGGRIRRGTLREPVAGEEYPIVEFVPRFVAGESYTGSFGYEWNTHDGTQYDEVSGCDVSARRFREETRWGSDLTGETVLEVGSGSGRFTVEALRTGATVASVDASSAVDANMRRNGAHRNLLLVQANLLELPFRKDFFDRAFCFGVLQHTPDPAASFRTLVEHVRPGGWIASDIYVKTIGRWLLNTRYWVRPLTRRMEPERLYRLVTRYVDVMWPLSRLVARVPRIGKLINWRLLIADYSRLLGQADDETLRRWAYLDTFDMLSPAYDKPQTVRTFRRWHEEAQLEEIDVRRGHNGIEGRARRREREPGPAGSHP